MDIDITNQYNKITDNKIPIEGNNIAIAIKQNCYKNQRNGYRKKQIWYKLQHIGYRNK